VPLALIDLIPPSGIPVGPLTIGFYGVSFIVAVVVMILVSQSEARHKGLDPGLVTSAIIVVAVCAIIGARLYHVIDDWHLYADDPLRAVLPPYSGLGLYGGILGAMIGAFLMSILANGCDLIGVPNYVQEIMIGVIIVAAVAVDRLRAT